MGWGLYVGGACAWGACTRLSLGEGVAPACACTRLSLGEAVAPAGSCQLPLGEPACEGRACTEVLGEAVASKVCEPAACTDVLGEAVAPRVPRLRETDVRREAVAGARPPRRATKSRIPAARAASLRAVTDPGLT